MENPLKLKRIHHVEFWVGNARQAAYFYRKGFGFSQVAYSGLETGQRQRASYALSQGKANFVLTTPMTPDDSAADHIRKHGDGVRDIALEVDDAGMSNSAKCNTGRITTRAYSASTVTSRSTIRIFRPSTVR